MAALRVWRFIPAHDTREPTPIHRQHSERTKLMHRDFGGNVLGMARRFDTSVVIPRFLLARNTNRTIEQRNICPLLRKQEITIPRSR
jgi:hypothetical protein